MKVLAVLILAAVCTAVAGIEINVPRRLFGRLTHCAGDDMKVSCSDDGEPFVKYKMTSVSVKIYVAASHSKVCKPLQPFPNKHGLCTKDYRLGDFGEFAGLGYQITAQCQNQRECFVRLPSSQLFSRNVCDDKSYFYGLEIDFQCTGPPATRIIPDSEKKPRLYRRSIRSQNSRERSATQDKPSRNVKSTENHPSRDNDVKSTEFHSKNQHSTETQNSKYDSRGNADGKDSRDFSRGSHSLGGHSRGGRRRVKSNTKDGRSIYSGSRSQIGSNSADRIAGAVISMIVMNLAAILLL